MPGDLCAVFLRFIGARPSGYLLVTAERDRTPEDGEELLHVSPVPGPSGAVDPKRLSELRAAAAAFLNRRPGGLIVLSCLETLALHNGVERVVRMVEDLHDDVSTRDATLLVLVDAMRTNPRLLAMLERELDILPTPPEFRPPLDGLIV